MEDTNGLRPLRVLAISRKAGSGTMAPTWRLRVEALVPALRDHGVQVEGIELPASGRAKRRLLSSLGGYDVVWLHRHITWPWELGRIRRVARSLVFDFDDPVCYSSGRRSGWSPSRMLKFIATVRSADAVLAASPRLVELAQPHCRRVHLAPLAALPEWIADRPAFRASGEGIRLVWIGSPSTYPYLLEIGPALREVGRRLPAAELTVVGGARPDFGPLQVVHARWSLQTQSAALARSHVGLAPAPQTRWAEGKATLKPVQYLAAGVPFVGSAVGVNTLLAAGECGLLAASVDDWPIAIERLANDEPLRRRMGEAGIRAIRSSHLPDVLASKVAEVFFQAARSGKRMPPRQERSQRAVVSSDEPLKSATIQSAGS